MKVNGAAQLITYGSFPHVTISSSQRSALSRRLVIRQQCKFMGWSSPHLNWCGMMFPLWTNPIIGLFVSIRTNYSFQSWCDHPTLNSQIYSSAYYLYCISYPHWYLKLKAHTNAAPLCCFNTSLFPVWTPTDIKPQPLFFLDLRSHNAGLLRIWGRHVKA